jgi:2-dehydro-3-deoxyphosphogluconate aldolase/(4S)-4-hydroxy-2-oxoglutarate aldolase
MQIIEDKLEELGVIPVVAIQDARDAADLGSALLDGGLPCAEITFRTEAALSSIKTLSTKFPQMLVGAGTVLTTGQAQAAVDHGAQFLVTPGFDDAVVEGSLDNDVPIFPGVATPTEINMALRYGLRILKFFPAQAFGGIGTLKAISAPYGDVSFIPTGGISVQNLNDYLALPSVLACGGSWLAKKTLIASGDFTTITRLTAEAVQLVQKTRSS